MPSLATIKLIGLAIGIAIVVGLAIAYRDSLIEKGKNIIYAEDNAALVLAQKKQIENDTALVRDQKVYIDHLESAGGTVKEKIRYVQGPCIKDGADDPRLGDTVDFLRGEQAPDSIPPQGGPAPDRKMRPPRAAAPAR